jgi:hypothetical protein
MSPFAISAKRGQGHPEDGAGFGSEGVSDSLDARNFACTNLPGTKLVHSLTDTKVSRHLSSRSGILVGPLA